MANLPSTTRAAKGLSLLGLLKNTPAYIKNTARDEVVVKKYEKAITKGGMNAIQAVCVSMTHKAPTPHKCTVIGMEKPESKTARPSKISSQKKVMVSCDCDFFKYTAEYALWTWGAAKIKYSNGEPAVVKNPSNIPLVCKHLAKVLRLIKERGD